MKKPIASADDGIAREDIINTIIKPAKFEKIVLIGDGLWDFQTAAKLGLALIGIGDEKIAKNSIDVGCDRVFKNFQAIENIKSVLEVAKFTKR